MTRKLRLTLSYLPLALGIWACTVASAADGQSSSKSALATSTATAPPVPVDDAPPPPPHKPPQEAFDACKSLSEGDACSVSFNGHTMNGTCRKGPNGEPELACAPAHPPGPPPSHESAPDSSTITGTALEHQLDQLEREVRGN